MSTVQIDPEAPAVQPAPRPPLWFLRPQPHDRRRHLLAIAAFVVVVALAGPAIGGTSRANQFLVNLWMMYSVAALGFYWIFGLAGRFAFCQTFMMAFGGYLSAWVTREGYPFIAGIGVAMATTAVAAGIVGTLVRKAQHFYFAIATFAVTQVGIIVFARADGFTGPNGQTVGIGAPELFGYVFRRDAEVFWLFLGVLAACLVVGALIERSPMRREAISARDNFTVAHLAGVRANRVHIVLFMIGSALGGLSGAMIGHWQGVMGSDSFGIDLTIGLFLILLLGGSDSMWGPVIGSAVFVALPKLLSDIERFGSIVYGVLLLAVVLALPNGIAESFRQLLKRASRISSASSGRSSDAAG
ncbi:branched-chain amino acid ABC transporter permease [Dactylosporangium sp. AC04546]|uniref:branched-chain amino acid ABC transporter permease n=1 Tax=Dactylosporangium sp. AC04546 TaxID=2862460 RepID=UPI001EE11707|nr:branched-chain amino acid ABC transporter permease [Dactylosporangium sp. AC04546]WVK88273.1 branched-chain amino acid ABC transporter permease [Dactylosporangium sp. AC04546]